MKPPSREVVKRDLHALLVGVAFGCLVISVAMGLFVGIWGWQRFLTDFWPLDNSHVGPNLVASMVTVVLVTAHNEARLVQKNAAHHVSLEQTIHDLIDQVIHPIETFESSVAEAVVEQQKEDE